jgi:HK97 family phage major capsid protein
MPTYNSVIDRSEAQALMPEEVSREILGNISEDSVVLKLGRRLPNMNRKQSRMPVLGSVPQAFFVNGDTGRKQTTQVSWDNVYINAEELAVLVPIPNAVADDADYDLWGEIKPPIVSAIGKAVDQAVLYGINAPSTWPECIVEAAEAAGHEITLGEVGDLYDDLLAENGVMAKVEEDGYFVTGHVAALSMRAKMRGLRDADDRPLFRATTESAGAASRYELDGEPLFFPRNGALDPSRSLLISGDWSQLVYAIRQDVTFEIFDQGIISDDSGVVVFNAMQQDSKIMRVVFRLGWALPNPINLVNSDAATRYPFAFLEPVAAS